MKFLHLITHNYEIFLTITHIFILKHLPAFFNTLFYNFHVSGTEFCLK